MDDSLPDLGISMDLHISVHASLYLMRYERPSGICDRETVKGSWATDLLAILR